MFISVTLQRSAVLTKSEGGQEVGDLSFRDYEYKVLTVKAWNAAESVNGDALASCFVTPAHVMERDRAQYDNKLKMAESQLVAKSTSFKNSRIPFSALFGHDNKTVTLAMAALGRSADGAVTTILPLLCHSDISFSRQFCAGVVASFGSLYALSQISLHTQLPLDEATCKQTTAAGILSKLRVEPRVASALSANELALLQHAYKNSDWRSLVFFAAAVPLEHHMHGTAIDNWPGVSWVPKRDLSIMVSLRAYAKQKLRNGDDQYRADDLERIVLLAYDLHQQQQKEWRRDNDMFSLADLLTAIYRRQEKKNDLEDDLPEEIVQRDGDLDAAKTVLELMGVWKRVPDRSALRMLTTVEKPTLWYCTARRHALLTSFVKMAILLGPNLVSTEGTGAYTAMPRPNLLCVYSGPHPTVAIGVAEPTNWRFLPLHSLLDRTRYFDNDDRYVADLMPFDRIVLCDAHLLDTATLLRFMGLCLPARSAGADIEIRGDPALPSSFSAMVDSQRFRVFAEGEEDALLREMAAEQPLNITEAPVEKETQSQWRHEGSFRMACALAANPYKSCQGIALLRTHILRKMSTDLLISQALLLQTTKITQQRWLLACGRWHADSRQCYSLLKLACDQDFRTAPLCVYFDTLAKTPARANELISFMSPYVGYNRQAHLVNHFYLLCQAPEFNSAVRKDHCNALYSSNAVQSVSLDSPRLYIDIATDIDHRICCRSWSASVLSVARHRHELSSQSFVQAQHALPFCGHTKDGQVLNTVVMFGQNYRFDDIYSIFMQSSLHSREPFTLLGVDPTTIERSLERRYMASPSPLVDMMQLE